MRKIQPREEIIYADEAYRNGAYTRRDERAYSVEQTAWRRYEPGAEATAGTTHTGGRYGLRERELIAAAMPSKRLPASSGNVCSYAYSRESHIYF